VNHAKGDFMIDVIIAGGGPTGVMLASELRLQGVHALVLEKDTEPTRIVRSLGLHARSIEVMDQRGLLDRFLELGTKHPVAGFFAGIPKPAPERLDTAHPYTLGIPQPLTERVLAERVAELGVEVRRGCELVGLSQDEEGVTVELASAGGTGDSTHATTLRSRYLVGCDGGRSTVRKQIDIEFEGYTWPERFLVITTQFDFQAALGCCLRNYMAGPEEWTNLFKVAGDDLKGRWRAVYNTRPDETDEEALSDDSVRARLTRCYAQNADWLHLNLYSVHQRVAKNFRKGRVFLCGDAAHVNNPIGGLGLNCGIHEAWDLANLLGGDESKLDAYERRRRPLNIKYVQEQTVANKKQLEERDPAQREKRFEELRRTAEDPARHKAFLMRASLLESARDAIRA